MDRPLLNTANKPVLPAFETEDIVRIAIRNAKTSDVHGMSTLINDYAAKNVMLARGPQYLFQHLQDYIVAQAILKNGEEHVVGCAALNILWGDLAEIRSLAVHANCHKKGLGRRLVQELIERAFDLEIPRIFCFTLVDTFFSRCGFKVFSRDLLPPVVWAECSKCPKFYNCDEISMLYDGKGI